MPPPDRRFRLLALGTSLLVHSLLFLVVIHGRLPQVPERRRPTLLVLPAPADFERTIPVPRYVPRVEQGRATRPWRPVRLEPEMLDTTVPVRQAPLTPTPPDSVPTRGPAGRLGPALGDGRLWVRPLPLPPRELARRLERSHEELVDSAVTAIVQRYLDSIAGEPGADRVKLPDWTAEVGGLKFGLDSRSIYIAGLRIPAAVLALLPLPASGDQRRAIDHGGRWIAEDLRRAAQRSTTVDEFKDAVRALREERQRLRDLERAQREHPDSAEARPR